MEKNHWPTPTARDWKYPSPPDGIRAKRKRRAGWTEDLADFAVRWSLEWDAQCTLEKSLKDDKELK